VVADMAEDDACNPLYVANEGKLLAIVDAKVADELLNNCYA
jgi:hydrogenase maturation factor